MGLKNKIKDFQNFGDILKIIVILLISWFVLSLL